MFYEWLEVGRSGSGIEKIIFIAFVMSTTNHKLQLDFKSDMTFFFHDKNEQ